MESGWAQQWRSNDIVDIYIYERRKGIMKTIEWKACHRRL